MAVFIMTGTHTLVGTPVSVPSNLGSAMPTTVKGFPLSRMVDPTKSFCPAKRVCQKLH